jgi:hypothetical protein
MNAPLTPEQYDLVLERLRGTSESVSSVLEHLEIDADPTDVEDQLADDIESCEGCSWWFEPGELTGDGSQDEPGLCDDCRAQGA